ncbi:hypothetical protein GIB67_023900 [Kingdonia uniflora]|uniref:WRKY domain-containing protein n=1 Tax=Kingdonia uniflora TaxID=39325 RepID=A0A7J7NGQ4_9MAGN|nr:hypothetical protein GIB67_023900 [Kingdonia uniflora]
MEKDRGDLADIVRASGGGRGGGGASNEENKWEPLGFESVIGQDVPIDNFGDPFSNMQDPLMPDIDQETWSFMDGTSSSSTVVKMNIEDRKGDISTSGRSNMVMGKSIFDEDHDQMRRPCNIFSKMLQISPNSNMSTTTLGVLPRETNKISSSSSSSLVGNDRVGVKANSSTVCSVESRAMQISSPRNPAIKRRKSQAKKVVCIPAPAAVNSRPTGEVVPSDLWAWRKYGQKPIKGSPYPRGYYRCSSSKGCSARKQVERSRTDPNMLVITYTSEHNHPWPTQRNALAGSTRSQPTKSNANSKISSSSQVPKLTNLKEEPENKANDSLANSAIAGQSLIMSSSIKEEPDDIPKPIDICNDLFDHQHGYIPEAPYLNPSSDDFFTNLEEFEADPLHLLFDPQGFTSEKSEEERKTKALDPFSLFDWTSNS